MDDRAFYITIKKKGLFKNKIDEIIISDGLNKIALREFQTFIIDTKEPLIIPIVRVGI